MRKPEGYDEAQAITGEGQALPAGLYVCKIIMAIETKRNGKSTLEIAYDVAEGEYKDFYQKRYNANTSTDKKWPAIYRQITEGKSVGFFKGLITSIEESNPGYKWNWDENTLKGKKFGAVMGREQFLTQDGQKKFATKIFWIRSVEGLKNATIPDDKLLQDNTAGYPEPDMPPTPPSPTDADAPLNW